MGIPLTTRRAVMARDSMGCVYCGAYPFVDGNVELDHVVPVSRGGTDTLDNLVVACRACNRSKRDWLPQEWLRGYRLLQFETWAVASGVTSIFDDGGAECRRRLVAQLLEIEVTV